jgi:hypothetical protein
MRIFIFIIVMLASGIVHAAEGMWTLDNLPKSQLQAKYGFIPDRQWVDKVMHASVRLAGGCSGSFISPDGLVMTNHHCARQCVEQLSTAKKDFNASGFLARTREEEVRCPEIELNRLEEIIDVTDKVKAATAGLDGTAYKLAQNAVKATLTSSCVGKDTGVTRCDVVDLYHGGLYHMYKYHRFQDARLVWAPEESIAFFGGDPDNFNFPRYDLDISMVRAYEHGKPAVIKDYFKFSKAGAKEGELTFVTGHPGRTQRLLTVSQLETMRDVILPTRLLQLSEMRGVLGQYAKSGTEAARISTTDFFGIENSYKALLGQWQALLDPRLLQQKRMDEQALRKFAGTRKMRNPKLQDAWNAIEKAQATYKDLATPYNVKEGARGFYSRYFAYARALVRGADERAKPNSARLPEFNDARLPEVEQRLFSTAPVYPEFETVKLGWSLTKMREWLGADDPFVKKVLGNESPDKVAERLIAATTLGDPAVRKALWQGGKDAIAKSNDPFIKLAQAIDADAREVRKHMEDEVDSVENKNAELIAKARFVQVGTGTYPDATFTLRLSYGEVKGWTYEGKTVPPFATIGGAYARHTGAAPFALPQSWLAAKDKVNLAQPLDFVTTNDIIGGNSGSPMINRNGEVVGLIFDGNIHSLGGAYWFDEHLNRTIAVHSGAILEALDKIYDAKDIAAEITGR